MNQLTLPQSFEVEHAIFLLQRLSTMLHGGVSTVYDAGSTSTPQFMSVVC